MAATRIFVANAEASDLCPRDHELGVCGRVRLVAFLDGILCGVSEAQPSFPRPRWAPLALARGSAAQLALVLLEADHLQPRRGAAFCYGAASLSLAGLAWQRRLASDGPLENAPGRYGTLSFEVCCDEPPPAPPSAPPQPEAHLAHPMDWCGVLRFAIDFRELSGTWSLEAAAGNGSSPSSGFISWTEEAEKSPVAPKAPQQLFVVERDVVFSAHAGLADRGLAGGCVRQLSQMRGPRGPCNMFLEPHPEPLTMDVAVKQPPQIHLRFFPADYLRPRPGMPCGISVRFTLAAAPPKLQMPLVIHVPAGCFSDQEHRPDASFSISHLGDCAEINLLDPLRLLGRSLWRVSAGFEAQVERGPGLSQLLALSESLVDILAMRLRAGDEKVVTLPVGEHSVVLRVVLAALRVDVPRPVLGIFMPPTDAADELRLEASSQGEVAGIFVHSLAVHSPHVRCCLVTASSDAGALLHPLPHMGGKVFIPAQCDHRGKVVVHAFLPEFGYHAVAETALGARTSRRGLEFSHVLCHFLSAAHHVVKAV
ncbi:unnamed protein product [Effrenium voratum]|uniref:Uncharacterized protein n=1 Tax=Effrenium voratum TaxID=2562239 RepID=A0AA36JPH9_9DINO|nr:unnamed protein product [Effrenium voratum]